jgi:hypothetical protein
VVGEPSRFAGSSRRGGKAGRFAYIRIDETASQIELAPWITLKRRCPDNSLSQAEGSLPKHAWPMHTELNYGREKLSLELPDDLEVTVIRKRAMPVLADPVAAIRKALQDPIAAPPLLQAARSARNVAIAICDITRPVPNHLFPGAGGAAHRRIGVFRRPWFTRIHRIPAQIHCVWAEGILTPDPPQVSCSD